MRRPSFPNGVGAAAILAFLASVSFAVLAPIITFSVISMLLVPAVALSYILYLFSHSAERVGRVTSLSLWIVFALGAWLIGPSLGLYILMHVGAVWLIRSLYFYSSITPALMDLALNVLSMATAFWAFKHSDSMFLAIWCFFLVQALFITIPSTLNRLSNNRRDRYPDTENFERARRTAETALRQLLAH